MIITYYKKPTGQMDEVMVVSKNVKRRDIQTASVILDFKKLEVVKCSMNGTNVPRDWTKIMGYFYQHYKATIDRLLAENGFEIHEVKSEPTEIPT
jgi:hypothetical protein